MRERASSFAYPVAALVLACAACSSSSSPARGAGGSAGGSLVGSGGAAAGGTTHPSSAGGGQGGGTTSAVTGAGGMGTGGIGSGGSGQGGTTSAGFGGGVGSGGTGTSTASGGNGGGAGASAAAGEAGRGGAGSGGGAGGTGPGAGDAASGGAGGSRDGGASSGPDAVTSDAAATETAAASYAPCPTDGTPCKILPFGDSITEGFSIQAQGGYRARLFHDALADHKNITFVGTLSDGPATVDGVAFPKNHEGHFAWSLEQLTGLLPGVVTTPNPHIILLLAGTNNRSGAASSAAQKLGTMIDQIVAAAPKALLAVAQIIPIPDNATDQAFGPAYNALIPGVVAQRASAGHHVIVVDQYTGFQVSTMISSDNIHPNQTGYNQIGDVWYAAIKSYLN